MGKRRFSSMEVTLLVLFLLMTATAVTMIALYFTREPKSIQDGKMKPPNTYSKTHLLNQTKE
uniref:Uncharacterized protein n=1 Tax=Oryzias sinensis TaxID=183150 RepID=A0A8C7XF13_9TELE